VKNRILFLLVEGDDDERFFQNIIKPKLEEKYERVLIRKYAQVQNAKINKLLKSIKEMGADYIYVVDINSALCVTGKKKKIRNKFQNINTDKIIVVIKEIESWYIAGLDSARSKQFKIPVFNNTDGITKEQFNDLIPKRFASRIDFMIEILNCYSTEIARQKNKSFRYFLGKYNCEF
jgi:hypothetical protein